MPVIHVSDKGQVTLPAAVRRQLGITPSSVLEMEVRGDELVIRPVRPLEDAKGVFRRYAEGHSADWASVRSATEAAVAQEVTGE